MEEKPYGELLDEEYVAALLAACDRERYTGANTKAVAEGDRLAGEFRKLFTDVSDKDIGTMLVVISRVLDAIYTSQVSNLSQNLSLCIGSYSHAAAVILKSVTDLREL